MASTGWKYRSRWECAWGPSGRFSGAPQQRLASRYDTAIAPDNVGETAAEPLALVAAQPVQIEDADAAIVEPQQAALLQHLQGLVGALARGARQQTQFLLRDLHQPLQARIQMRVEHRRQAARHARVQVQQAF